MFVFDYQYSMFHIRCYFMSK